MTMNKRRYNEGDWFAVPVRGGGYAQGVVARMDGLGSILGYFFGPRLDHVPTILLHNELQASRGTAIFICSDLGLQDGTWPVLGRIEPWNREAWPLPPFGSVAVDGSIAWRTEYSDDTLRFVRRVEVPIDEAKRLPEDRFPMSGAVEIILNAMLPHTAP